MRRLILLTTLLVVVSLLVGCAQSQTMVTVADHDFMMYVADTAAEWEMGLGDIHTLSADEGMVFIFPSSEERTFWMKGVEYPIDIVWVDDLTVVGSVTAYPETTSHEGDYVHYPSLQPVDLVIELPAGTVGQQGITIGDKVVLDGY